MNQVRPGKASQLDLPDGSLRRAGPSAAVGVQLLGLRAPARLPRHQRPATDVHRGARRVHPAPGGERAGAVRGRRLRPAVSSDPGVLLGRLHRSLAERCSLLDPLAGGVLSLLPDAELLHSVPHGLVSGPRSLEAQSVRPSVRLSGDSAGDRLRRLALHLAAGGRVFAGNGVRCGRLRGRHSGVFDVGQLGGSEA